VSSTIPARPSIGNCPNIIAVCTMRATTLSAARGSSSAIQSRIAVRSSRACGVKLTFKTKIAQNLRNRDHRIPILRLLQTLLDLGALPCVITALRVPPASLSFSVKGWFGFIKRNMRLRISFYKMLDAGLIINRNPPPSPEVVAAREAADALFRSFATQPRPQLVGRRARAARYSKSRPGCPARPRGWSAGGRTPSRWPHCAASTRTASRATSPCPAWPRAAASGATRKKLVFIISNGSPHISTSFSAAGTSVSSRKP
jgi:hypothetical protein